MKPIVVSLPESHDHAERLADLVDAELGELDARRFPDGESWVRIGSDCGEREVIVVADLSRPDRAACPLIFAARTLEEMGAARVGLVAPYLAYMRQDEQFAPGEAVTSRYFAELLSGYFDWLVTLDPHLHRHDSLADIYEIPTHVAHAADDIADWVEARCERSLIVGPDDESRQWVVPVARRLDAPHVIFEKERRGDREVVIETAELEAYRDRQPVIVDDIISTGTTMVETIDRLVEADLQNPYCVGIHGLFVEQADERLEAAGARAIVSCNGTSHPTNAIDVLPVLAEQVSLALGRGSADAAE